MPSPGKNPLTVGLLRRLTGGVAWSLVGSAINSICNLAVAVGVARILGKELFGQYGTIESTILSLSGMAQLATGYTATKYVAEFRSTDSERTGRIIALCSAVSAVTGLVAFIFIFVGAPWLAQVTLKAPQLSTGLRIAAAMIYFSVITGYQMGALAGLEGYRSLAVATGLTNLFNLAFSILGAWVWGLNGAIAAMSITAVIQWAIFRTALWGECKKQRIDVRLRGILKEKGIIGQFALPAALSGMSSMPAYWAATAFLVRQPGGFTQMAYYMAASNLRAPILYLPLVLNKVSMSLLNHQKGVRAESNYRTLFFMNLRMTAVLVFGVSIIVAAVGPWLMRAFGKDFQAGYSVLVATLISIGFDGLMQAPYQIVQSQERMWLSFAIIVLPRDLSIVALAYFLTPISGALGLAGAYAGGSLLALVMTSLLVWHIGLLPAKEPLGAQSLNVAAAAG